MKNQSGKFDTIDGPSDSKAVVDPTAMELESFVDDKSDLNATNYDTVLPDGSPNKSVNGSRIEKLSRKDTQKEYE